MDDGVVSSDGLSVDKSKNGFSVDYDWVHTAATVRTDSRFGGCTAQVINNRFLLTAGHCIYEGRSPVWNNDASTAGVVDLPNFRVWFTTSDGSQSKIYDGAAAGVVGPNYVAGSNDMAVIWLLDDTMPVCTGSVEWCSTNRRNRPMTAWFQYAGNRTIPTLFYLSVGYGGTSDHPSSSNLKLRAFVPSLLTSELQPYSAPGYSESDFPYWMKGIWYDNSDARPCPGDSGGALVVSSLPSIGLASPQPNRILHFGIMGSSKACENTSGRYTFTVLKRKQAEWISGIVGLVQLFGFGRQSDCQLRSLSGGGNALKCGNGTPY